MKVVALSSLEFTGAYVIGQLARHFPISKLSLIRVMPSPVKQSSSLAKLLRWQIFPSLEHRLFYPRLFARQLEHVEQGLASQHFQLNGLDSTDVSQSEINSSNTAELLTSMNPDVLLVCCGPLLKEHIFSIPKIATINVHFGISPHYRGENTIFWPLYFGDYENIGVTIHRINAGIDTGEIFAQGFPEITPSDNETTLFAKCVELAGNLAVETLQRLAAGQLGGLPQSFRGRCFRLRERRVHHDLKYFALRKLGRRKLPRLDERRQFHLIPAAMPIQHLSSTRP